MIRSSPAPESTRQVGFLIDGHHRTSSAADMRVCQCPQCPHLTHQPWLTDRCEGAFSLPHFPSPPLILSPPLLSSYLSNLSHCVDLGFPKVTGYMVCFWERFGSSRLVNKIHTFSMLLCLQIHLRDSLVLLSEGHVRASMKPSLAIPFMPMLAIFPAHTPSLF